MSADEKSNHSQNPESGIFEFEAALLRASIFLFSDFKALKGYGCDYFAHHRFKSCVIEPVVNHGQGKFHEKMAVGSQWSNNVQNP